MTTEPLAFDVEVAAWPIAFDVGVDRGPVLIDVAVDTRPIIVVVGQLFPDIHVPADLGDWLDFAPHGVGAGANIKVPFDTARLANFAPSIHIGVRIAPPVDALSWEDVAPSVYIGGVRVAVPVDAAEVTEFAPTIQAGINLALPFDAADWTDRAPSVGYGINLFVPADAVDAQDYAPLILAGVRLAVPGDAAQWADFSPSLSIVVDLPGDAMVVADFVPAVAAGMSIAVPSDGMTWADYEPALDRFDFNADFNNDFNAVPHGENLAIPADAMVWADSTPTVEAESAIFAEYVGISSYSSGSSSYSISTGYGAAEAGRRIIHAVHFLAGSGANPSVSVTPTINGVAATILKTTINVPGGSLLTLGTVWLEAGVESGTSGNLSIAFTGTVGVRVATYRAIKGGALELVDDAATTWGSQSTGSKTINLDAVNGGAVLAASFVQHDGSEPSLSAGVDQKYSNAATGAYKTSGGIVLTTAAEAGRAVTLTKTTGANWNGAFSAISVK